MTDGTDGEITVMVVDDHPIWREGVARDLTERGLQVVATAPDAAAAVRIALATRPRVVLMDLNLGATSGVEAIEGILAKLPETRVLVLSQSGEQADVLEAVKAGATGYLVKSAGVEGSSPRCSARRRGSRCSRRGSPDWCWGVPAPAGSPPRRRRRC